MGLRYAQQHGFALRSATWVCVTLSNVGLRFAQQHGFALRPATWVCVTPSNMGFPPADIYGVLFWGLPYFLLLKSEEANK